MGPKIGPAEKIGKQTQQNHKSYFGLPFFAPFFSVSWIGTEVDLCLSETVMFLLGNGASMPRGLGLALGHAPLVSAEAVQDQNNMLHCDGQCLCHASGRRGFGSKTATELLDAPQIPLQSHRGHCEDSSQDADTDCMPSPLTPSTAKRGHPGSGKACE